MTVDEAIKFCKAKQENIKLRTEPETFLYIEVMLDELKVLRSCVKSSAFKDGYNRAIDDVIQKVKSIGLSGISSSQGNLIYVLENLKGNIDEN